MDIVDMLLTRGANMEAESKVRYFVSIKFFELRLMLLLLYMLKGF